METIERSSSLISGHFPSLGQLYDVRYEKLSCFSLFNESVLDFDFDLKSKSSRNSSQPVSLSFTKTNASVKILQTPNLSIKIDCEDSLRNEFELFDLCPEQQLSVLTGIGSGLRCGGSNLFEDDEDGDCSNYLARGSLVYSILTEEHQLDISLLNSESGSESEQISDFPGTHVVTALKWGGNFILTVTVYSTHDSEKEQTKIEDAEEEETDEEEDDEKSVLLEEIRQEIKLVLERIRTRVQLHYFKSSQLEFEPNLNKSSENCENVEYFEKHEIKYKLKFHLHGDFLYSSVHPKNENEAVDFLNAIPLKLKSNEVNGGKGVHVKFSLTPVQNFRTILKNPSASANVIFNKHVENFTIPSAVILNVTGKIEKIRLVHRKLKCVLSKVQRFENYIPDSDLNFVIGLHDNFHTHFEKFREKLKKLVITIRCGCYRNENESECHGDLIIKIVEKYDKNPSSAQNIKEILGGRRIKNLQRHLDLLRVFQSKEIFILSGEGNLDMEILKRSSGKSSSQIFVLFKAGQKCDQTVDLDWKEMCRNFLRLKETEKLNDCEFLFVDCRLDPKIWGNEEDPHPETSKIFHYVDGKLVSRNYGISSLAVHEKVRCEVCSVKPIVGTRYKCEKCRDFNLCEKCHSSQFHRHHPFKSILYFPRRFPGIAGSTIHKGVRCDGCRENPIVGNRFRCTICEDFDLCEKCHWHKLHDLHPMKKLSVYKLFGTRSVNDENEK